MAELKKAQLIEMVVDAHGKFNPKDDGMTVSVQFNPESLKVTYNNQVKWPAGGDQNGTAAIQFVGMGTTKLAVTLWFDSTAGTTTGDTSVSAPSSDSITALATGAGAQVTDVRSITEDVAYFIEPQIPSNSDPETTKSTKVRAVRFEWGTFYFDGIMETMEENLEFFAPDGTPIRSSVTFSLSRNRIQFLRSDPEDDNSGGTPPSPQAQTPGDAQLTQTPQGSSVQQLAGARGVQGGWQSIAAANGIENPRMLATGQLLNMGAGISAGTSFSAGVTAGIGSGIRVGGGVSAGFGGGLSAGMGGGFGGALSVGGSVGGSATASVGVKAAAGASIRFTG